jgi:hypothetical protein
VTVEDDKENVYLRKQGKRVEAGAEPQTGIDVDGPAPSQFTEAPEPDSSPSSVSAEPVTSEPKDPKRYVNAGSITMGIFALSCVVLGAVQGFIPIFLFEGFAFAGLAWLCAVRWPVSDAVRGAILVASLLLAVLVGVTLDQDSLGPRYRYLSQGAVQYRVDEKAGRTDRLGTGGWFPVAFDKEAVDVIDVLHGNMFDIPLENNLTNGMWTPSLAWGRVCFNLSVASSSVFVLKGIDIEVSINKKGDAPPGKSNFYTDAQKTFDNTFPLSLHNEGGGLMVPGGTYLVCGSAPRDLSADETWSYSLKHFYGWKR